MENKMKNLTDDIKYLKEMLNQYGEFCNTGDLEGWISLWEEGGVQMPFDILGQPSTDHAPLCLCLET